MSAAFDTALPGVSDPLASGGDSATQVVVGDGWAALAVVGFLVTNDTESRIAWFPQSGCRLHPPVGAMEDGPGIHALVELARRLGVPCSDPAVGSFFREFRNKSFRMPAWYRPADALAREELRAELLWGPEQRLVPPSEARVDPGLWEVLDAVRAKLLELAQQPKSRLRRFDTVPIQSIESEGGKIGAVVTGGGERIACQSVLYADRWTLVPALSGLSKGFVPSRGKQPVGVLQAVFEHSVPFRSGVRETFFAPCNRDPGETVERHVWGYFSEDGTRSAWTVLLESEEGEDNHQVAKKLRRLKQALDRVFSGAEWWDAGRAGAAPPVSGNPAGPTPIGFSATVRSERVRFEEAALFSSGEPATKIIIDPKLKGIRFLTDGYGLSHSFAQATLACGVEASPVRAVDQSNEAMLLSPS
jgi:hypothetical protein